MLLRLSPVVPVLLCSLLLAACGFQLRGTAGSGVAIPDDWKSMSLSTGNPNGELSREVSSRFAAHGVTWQPRPQANYTLVLGGEQFRQRNLSLNSEARVAEFELTMTAEFRVLDKQGKEAMPATQAIVVKQMENDPRNVVGKSEEVRLLKNEMRGELAQQIMRRIGFYAATIRNHPVAPTGSDPADNPQPADAPGPA